MLKFTLILIKTGRFECQTLEKISNKMQTYNKLDIANQQMQFDNYYLIIEAANIFKFEEKVPIQKKVV